MQEINKDLEKRVKGFNEKLIPLLSEYKLALGSEAFLTKEGRIASKPALFDNPEPQKGGDIDTNPNIAPKGDSEAGESKPGEEKVESEISEG